jgi:hypothetical protein
MRRICDSRPVVVDFLSNKIEVNLLIFYPMTNEIEIDFVINSKLGLTCIQVSLIYAIEGYNYEVTNTEVTQI